MLRSTAEERHEISDEYADASPVPNDCADTVPVSDVSRFDPKTAPASGGNLARYKDEHRIVNLVSALNVGYSVQLTNNPDLGNGSGGTCSGDSGSPILHIGDMIVAVNSFGIAPHCKGNDFT